MPVGTVVAVENFGAGDIIEIEQPDGKRFMVPVAQAEIGEIATISDAFLP
jgi:16S rRNA processing protein RimM